MDKNAQFYLLWLYAPMTVAIAMFLIFPKSNVELGGDGAGEGSKIKSYLGINKYKITGAFAGYLLILLLSRDYLSEFFPDDDEYEVWTIEGTIQDHNGSLIKDGLNPTIKLVPPQEISNGKFTMKVVGEKGMQDKVVFKDLILEANTYRQYTLPSLNYRRTLKNIGPEWKVEYDVHTAVLANPIKLELDLSPIN
jgi:hypothetical protein